MHFTFGVCIFMLVFKYTTGFWVYLVFCDLEEYTY